MAKGFQWHSFAVCVCLQLIAEAFCCLQIVSVMVGNAYDNFVIV